MPVAAALPAFAALIAGVVYPFDVALIYLGKSAAVSIAVLAVLAVATVVVRRVQRRRAIASNAKERSWTHVLVKSWGGIRLSVTKELLWLSLYGMQAEYTLADLHDCAVREIGGRWYVLLKIRDPSRANWQLPMSSKQEAGRWARILTLARTRCL